MHFWQTTPSALPYIPKKRLYCNLPPYTTSPTLYSLKSATWALMSFFISSSISFVNTPPPSFSRKAEFWFFNCSVLTGQLQPLTYA